MSRIALALTLLATFGFGLLAGPHPCSARHKEERGRPSASCHGMEDKGAVWAQASLPSHESANCCDTFCGHACQMTAAGDGEPGSLIIAPVAPAVAEAPDLGPSLVPHAIDHVPLS